MLDMKIQHAALLNLLKDSFQTVYQTFQEYDLEKVFEAEDADNWSAAGHFQHLILSNAGIASAFKAPKTRLAAFGTPAAPEETYEVLQARYMGGVKGVKAPSNLEPKFTEADTLPTLFQNWGMVLQKFEQRLQDWTEEELDQYAVRHPFLGALSTRQLLYFAIFHNEHHLKSIKRIQAKQQA